MSTKKVWMLSTVLIIIVSGCSGVTHPQSSPTENPTITSMTASTPEYTETTPEKGASYLTVSEISKENTMEFEPSKRAEFDDLNESQQRVILEALRCDCGVKQEFFRYNDYDRIEAVKYKGQWYFLRVVIV